MRIGFDAKRAFNNPTGLGNYSRTLIRQLSQLYPEHQYFLFTPSLIQKFELFPPPNVKVILPDNPVHRFFSSFWRSVSMGKTILNNKIDIYHGLSNELPANINKSGAKSVVTIHDLIFLRYPGLYKRIDRLVYKRKFLSASLQAERIVAVSQQTRSDLISFFNIDPEKIEVVYQGCNPAFYEKVSEERKIQIRNKYKLPENFILYVGTIEERKNLLFLIRAVHEHKIKLPLVVFGRKTPYMEKINTYIDRRHVKNIYFHEYASQTDLPPIYQMSDIFVYPSSFEGFGIPVLEAINSGIPVIAAKGSCLEETGGKSSIYVDPFNPAEVASAINRVLHDKDLRQQMIDDGYEHALNFREKKTAARLMEVYQKLL